MNNEIKEIYLSNLEWTKTHDNMGGVMGNIVFKNNISYEEYQKLFKSGYFVLCDKDYIINLQEKNERLKELCDKYEEEHNNEFKIWKDERHQLLDYKERCEKTIEYIKSNYIDNPIEFKKDLLKILVGGDK